MYPTGPGVLSRLTQLSALSVAVVAAAIGALSHAVTHESCRVIPTAYDGRPDPGTPAAPYCNAVWHGCWLHRLVKETVAADWLGS
jgi:hypothetical protein